MNDPLVSIIIPTYNRPKYLLRAIKSSLNQTYKEIEVIVIDDQSDHDISSIIKEIGDPRVKYFRNEINKGSAYSRNRGISLCRGEYVNFLDDDDELLPRKIELQLKKFNSSQVQELGVVACDMEYRRQDINQIKLNRLMGDIYKKLLNRFLLFGIHSMLIKTRYLPKFDPNLCSNQEYDFAITLASKCKFDFVPNVLAITQQSVNQISFSYEKKAEGTRYFFKKYKTEFLRFGFKSFIFNWLRFRYLIIKYFFVLSLKNSKINDFFYKLHDTLLRLINP